MKDQISENTAVKLERVADILWEAMQEIARNKGYSDLTLYLEGSSYDLREIVEKSKNIF